MLMIDGVKVKIYGRNFKMRDTIEKIENYFVLCSIDNCGNTVYLRSLHEPGKWEITADVDKASRCVNKATAELTLQFYESETQNYDKWVIVPLVIEYKLVDET